MSFVPFLNRFIWQAGFLFAFLLNSIFLSAQASPLAVQNDGKATSTEDVAGHYGAQISEDMIKDHIYLLADDSLEGRETGRRGQRMAAEYIAQVFELAGLSIPPGQDDYFQNVPYYTESWKEIFVQVNRKRFSHMRDFFAIPGSNPELKNLEARDVLFLGYGIDDEAYSDYKGVDVSGRVILIYSGEPVKNGESIITGDATSSRWTTDWTLKLKTAKEHGVAAVFIIDSELPRRINRFRRFLLEPNYKTGYPEADHPYAPHLYISGAMAGELMGRQKKNAIRKRDQILATGKPQNHRLRSRVKIVMEKEIETMIGENVLGIIEGSDPDLKHEFVFLTAHYDHLGMRGDDIFNGADDNASGTSALLELGRVFAKAAAEGKGPRRSIGILLVAGEEKGLLGSAWYADHPIIPLEQTVAAINIDMIGRIDDRYVDDPNYIYVIGSDKLSSELHEINEEQNRRYTQIPLDYTYNDDDDPNRFYYRSDHYNFAKHNIPIIFYFSGTHKDYHRPGDTADKILFDRVTRVGQLAFYTVWEVADREARIVVDMVEE